MTNVDYIEEFYRQRLRALQAVDELVEGVVRKLEEVGQLDNTIIIYTSYAQLFRPPLLSLGSGSTDLLISSQRQRL